MDEIEAVSECVRATRMRNVVAKLIFLLVALDGKRGDGGDELIVAERFQA